MKYNLRAANGHMNQCDGTCEIPDEDLVNMEGLPLSLVVEKEGSESDDHLKNTVIKEVEQEGPGVEEEASEGLE